MRRRNWIGSHSREGRPSTRTSPDDGTNIRLMSLRQVVLPEPLRPSNMSVSPRLTERSRPDSKTRSGATRNSTLQNSIAHFGVSHMDPPPAWKDTNIAHQRTRTAQKAAPRAGPDVSQKRKGTP